MMAYCLQLCAKWPGQLDLSQTEGLGDEEDVNRVSGIAEGVESRGNELVSIFDWQKLMYGSAA